MRRSGLALLILAACGPQVALDDDGAAATDTQGGPADDGATTTSAPTVPPSITTGPGPATVTTVDVTITTSETTDPGPDSFDEIGFVDDGWDLGCFDEPPPGTSFHCTNECDLFAQDCPEGEKCVPWANDGGDDWTAVRCSPLDPDPAQVGEACLVEGSGVSGIDNCDIGLMCLHVDPDPLEGVCVAMCTGTADMPICEDGTACTITHDGVISLCVETCDPLASTCTFGDCIPISAGIAGPVDFGCFVDTGDAPPGEPCEHAGDCAQGATCALSLPCEIGEDCCQSYCDLDAPDPSAPCMPGQACNQIYSAADAEPELLHFGLCGPPIP